MRSASSLLVISFTLCEGFRVAVRQSGRLVSAHSTARIPRFIEMSAEAEAAEALTSHDLSTEAALLVLPILVFVVPTLVNTVGKVFGGSDQLGNDDGAYDNYGNNNYGNDGNGSYGNGNYGNGNYGNGNYDSYQQPPYNAGQEPFYGDNDGYYRD